MANSLRAGGMRYSQYLLSMVAVLAIFAATYACYMPVWQSNDDVAMSMVAHGYGLAANPSVDLFFSSVVWGNIIQLIPTVHGLLGYSIATLCVLFVSGFALLYCFQCLNIKLSLAVFATALLLFQPLLFPQFTINAGLLAVSSILMLWVCVEKRIVWMLAASVVMFCVAYSIRNLEAVAVLAVAIPYFSWKKLRDDKALQLALAMVLLYVLAQGAVDAAHYQGDAWKKFLDINLARSPFTDFGIDQQIKQYPELLKKYHLSNNDIDMLTQFFFIDPAVMNPPQLQAMLAELPAITVMQGNIQAAADSVLQLFSPNILVITLPALLLCVFARDWRVIIAWAIVLAMIFALGLLGRGGQHRVLIPLVSFLLALALCSAQRRLDADSNMNNQKLSHLLMPVILLIAGIVDVIIMTPQAHGAEEKVHEAQKSMLGIPHELIVVWGAALPFEYIYPVFATDTTIRSLPIFGIGAFSYAPFSVANNLMQQHDGFIERIRSDRGLAIVTNDTTFSYLGIWCKERFDAKIKSEIIHDHPPIVVRRVWCKS